METNDQDPLDLEGFQMISLGWTNPARGNTFRELPENELAKRVDELVAKVTDSSRTIFNFHARRTAADSTKRRAWTKTTT